MWSCLFDCNILPKKTGGNFSISQRWYTYKASVQVYLRVFAMVHDIWNGEYRAHGCIILHNVCIYIRFFWKLGSNFVLVSTLPVLSGRELKLNIIVANVFLYQFYGRNSAKTRHNFSDLSHLIIIVLLPILWHLKQ